MARRQQKQQNPGGEIWHLSNAGPGSFKTTDDGRRYLNWKPGGLALLLAPTAVRDAARGRVVHWLCTPTSNEDYETPGMQFQYPSEVHNAVSKPVHIHFQRSMRHLHKGYYEKFANTALWLTMHGRPHFMEPDDLRASWGDYKDVNRLYAESVIGQASHGATVVVHDFQLALAAKMIKDSRPDLHVTGYWHIPMATKNELFQRFSGNPDMGLPDDIASEILEAMGTSVQWGFHSNKWIRNFTSCFAAAPFTNTAQQWIVGVGQTALRKLNISKAKPQLTAVPYEAPGFIDPDRTRRQVHGLDEDELAEETRNLLREAYRRADADEKSAVYFLENDEYFQAIRDIDAMGAAELDELARQLAPDEYQALLHSSIGLTADDFDKVLNELHTTFDEYNAAQKLPRELRSQIVNITGRADPKNGILRGLQAYEKVLDEWTGDPALKPSLILTCSRSRAGVPAYDDYWNQVRDMVLKLQRRPDHDANVAHLFGDGVGYADTLAAQAMADIAMVPSERGGRDLVAIEPVAGKAFGDKSVAVIVARGAAASETLDGAYVVDGAGPAPVLARTLFEGREAWNLRQASVNALHEAKAVGALASAMGNVLHAPQAEIDGRFDKMMAAVAVEHTEPWIGNIEAHANGRHIQQIGHNHYGDLTLT